MNTTTDPWAPLRRLTAARIALGRSGAGLPTKPWLDFGVAHALARDAVHAPFDADGLQAALAADGWPSLRVHSDRAPEAAATGYQEDLQQFLDQGGRIPLGLLGMGADGHTASLFTTEDLERAEGHLVIVVDRPDGMQGISVTPALLQKIDRIIFLITGADKAPMVNRLLQAPETLTAGLAIRHCKQVEVWLDEAAHG